jgi:hypothetical protein
VLVVPDAADIDSQWKPVFDATTQEVIEVLKNDDTVPTPLMPITPIKITTDENNQNKVVDSFDD